MDKAQCILCTVNGILNAIYILCYCLYGYCINTVCVAVIGKPAIIIIINMVFISDLKPEV